jgi:hypothetical protein
MRLAVNAAMRLKIITVIAALFNLFAGFISLTPS